MMLLAFFFHGPAIHSLVFNNRVTEASELVYLSILNSKLFWFFISNTSTALRGDAYRLTPEYLNPFCFPDLINKREELKVLNANVTQMLEVQKELHKGTNEVLKKRIEILDRQIDQSVYQLYGLTPEEIKIVEESGEVIQKKRTLAIIFGSGATKGSRYTLNTEKISSFDISLKENKVDNIPADFDFWNIVSVKHSQHFKALRLFIDSLYEKIRERKFQNSMETTWSVLNAAHQLRQGHTEYKDVLLKNVQEKTEWDEYELYSFFDALESKYVSQYKANRSEINKNRKEKTPHYLCGDANTEFIFLIKTLYENLTYTKKNSFEELFKIVKKNQNKIELKCIVTFNYDLLAEENLTTLKMPFAYPLYADKNPFQKDSIGLFKLHGSLNWLQSKDPNYLQAFDHVVSQEYFDSGEYIQPAIVPPTISKDEIHNLNKYDELRKVLNHQWHSAKEYLKNADTWLFVGYGLPDTDEKAKELIKNSYKNQVVIVVTKASEKNNSNDLKQKYSALLGQENIQMLDKGFDSEETIDQLKEILKASGFEHV